MKNIKKIISLYIIILISVNCGESEDERNSRIVLSGNIREINIVYADLISNKKEKELTVFNVTSYFNNIRNQLVKLRRTYIRQTITSKYSTIQMALDSILVSTLSMVEFRNEYYNRYFDFYKKYSKYRKLKDDENYLRSIGAEFSADKYSIDANILSVKMISDKINISNTLSSYDSLCSVLSEYVFKTNLKTKDLSITDSLNIKKTLIDSADFMRVSYRDLEYLGY